MNRLANIFRNKNIYWGLATMAITLFIIVISYASLGIYLGSSTSILASDSFSQTANFFASFNNALHGK